MQKSNIGVTNYIMQAKKTLVNGNYDYMSRCLSDVGLLLNRYPKLLPGQSEIQGLNGRVTQLFMHGTIELFNHITNRTNNVKIKITFPKDYPRTKPLISLENLNQQLYEPNPHYLSNGLARYDRSPKDNKMYIFLELYELKVWNNNSELMRIMNEVEKKLVEFSPYIKRNSMRETQTANFITTNNESHPAIRQQLAKTKNQLTELENDLELLVSTRQQLVLTQAYTDVSQREIIVKLNELNYLTAEIHKITDQNSKITIDQSSIDHFLQANDKTKKMVIALSQRDALDESLQYLKDHIKKGVPLSNLNESLKKLFQEFYSNQTAINQL